MLRRHILNAGNHSRLTGVKGTTSKPGSGVISATLILRIQVFSTPLEHFPRVLHNRLQVPRFPIPVRSKGRSRQKVSMIFPRTRGRLAAGTLLLLTLCSCSTNPYTERWQLQMLPQSYLNQLGTQSYLQVKNDPKVTLSKDPREIDPVQRVAKRIIEAAKHSKYAETAGTFEWEVNVIKDDKTLNAWALPGGKIAVYTGIFSIAKNEAGLAAIMGHEVVHALAGHGGERMSQGLMAQVLMSGAALAVESSAGPGTGQAVMQALGAGAQVGVLLPFSRKHESEADYIGVLLAAQAGYDPEEAVRVWERMAQAGGSQPAEFMSTHPSHGTRINQLQEWMPEALGYYQQAPHAPPAPDLPAIGKGGSAPGPTSPPQPQQLRKNSKDGK